MALTLAEAKVTMVNKIDQAVIDEFRRESFLLDKLTFDDTVSPGTGGSTMIYGYTRLETPSTAEGREINSEYSANEAKRKECTAKLKIFGGAFNVDRVIQSTSGNLNEIQFQLKEKIKAARNYFHYMAISGDSAQKSTEFDGLDTILTGTSTEYKEALGLDISTSDLLDANYKYFLDTLDDFLSGLDGKPDAIMGCTKLITRIQAVARRAGYLTQREDSFGRKVACYDDIILCDLGQYYNGTETVDIAGCYSAEINGNTETGLCDLYTAKFGLDAFHAASPAGGKVINTYLPDLKAPGAIKKGEVEMVAATVLKNSRKAGVFRSIKVK